MKRFDDDTNDNESKAVKIQRNIVKVPMTLKMLNKCFDDQKFTIDQQEFTQAVIVAKLVDKSMQNMKELLTFQDGSSVLILTNLLPTVDLFVGNYFKFFVTLSKVGGNDFRLSCLGIKQVQSFNIISDHIGNVIARHLERTQGFIQK